MYVNNHMNSNIGSFVLDKLIQFKNIIRNILQKNDKTEYEKLTEYLDEFSDLLSSIDSLGREFAAFAGLRIYIDYVIEHDCLLENKKFIEDNIDLFWVL